MATIFKVTRNGKKSCQYYGKVMTAPNTWQKVKLYTDRKASETRLRELQQQADRRRAGILSADIEALSLPITELLTRYVESMKARRLRPDHITIKEGMIKRLIDTGGWKFFRDITRDSMEKIICKLAEQGKTPSYQNTYIKCIKAFVTHWLPDDWSHPLKKLKRVNERGGKQTKARRAVMATEYVALLRSDIPEYRRMSYALACLNGLRRGEVKSLTWERVHLNAPIPFIEVPQKMGSDDRMDVIPLHPYVCKLFRQRMAIMPEGSRVVPFVPDVPTLENDWNDVGVTMKDERGRSANFHALRHTFQTQLDLTSCSRATRKKLMRHAGDDVTDSYAHAELPEMAAALSRLFSPDNPPPQQQVPQQQAITGTDGRPQVGYRTSQSGDHRGDQGATISGHFQSSTVTDEAIVTLPTDAVPLLKKKQNRLKKQRFKQCDTSGELIAVGNGDNLSHPWPDTQVD